jgi:hypothetical protein
MWDMEIYTMLIDKPWEQRPLKTHRHRWVDNIKINLQKKSGVSVDWIKLAQDRVLVNTVMNTVVT